MDGPIIPTDATVRDLASLLERHRVLFVQRKGLLVGSVTNGDFRRGIAEGASLNDSVTGLMNCSPTTVHQRDAYKTRLERMRRLPQGLRYLPVVDDQGRILEIVSDKALMTLPNVAVLMAGGLGSRLKTLTTTTPKPMLTIAGKPILQLILEQFRRAGVSQFIISLNYKADLIENYFGDGSQFEVRIRYIHETDRMGTAGCLGLLDEVPEQPFFVMNGDILAELDPQELLQFHLSSDAAATVCLHHYQLPVPYGVITTKDRLIENIEEKPHANYSINAGIYVLTPQCVDFIPRQQYFDMTSLLKCVLDRRLMIAAYKLPGFWIDIGDLEDFQRAHIEYDGVFGQEP